MKDLNIIPTKELLLISAMIGIMDQYMDKDSEDYFLHKNMSSGEYAAEALIYYNIADDDGYGIRLCRKKADEVDDILMRRKKHNFMIIHDYENDISYETICGKVT